MTAQARRTARVSAALGCALVISVTAGHAQRARSAVPSDPDTATIVHVLNRLGYGPTPGDVERVRRMGLAAYINQQLDPSSIRDEGLEGRLTALPTLSMTTRQLADTYYIPALERRRAAQRAAGAGDPTMANTPATPVRDPDAARRENAPLSELSQAKLLRAVYSERQLEEVLVDFWFNHFNVFAGKGATRLYVVSYERETIRPHALGKFRDLLGAVAESPAMLFYLDNWQSAAPAAGQTTTRRRPMIRNPQAPQNRPRGINENYARELMELHTLGVDGGYTQKDVQEVARAFTGWTITTPRLGGDFRFEPRLHDDGEKVVLGTRLPRGGGKKDGERVLDLLARHPSTATFIATKLARRLVSDTPPTSLVERTAARFRETDGDIREVVRTIVTSPEFFAPEARRAKVKTPLEFVASAVRASGVDVRNAGPLMQTLRQQGMAPYMCQPPTGYGDTADAWVNTGALLHRMNFAVSLSSGTRGLRTTTNAPVAARIAEEVLAGDVSANTRATIEKGASEPQKVALLLGSPDFQKR